MPPEIQPAVSLSNSLRPPVSLAQPRPIMAPATRRPQPDLQHSQPSVVRVTIGRIDVRAQFPAPVSHDAGARKVRSSSRSLDDYLKERAEGKR